MKKYIKEYIIKEEKLLKEKTTKKDIEELLTKISFFQHERLVHLIVMIFTILSTLIFIFLSFKYNYFIFCFILTLTLSIFYIMHYYFLENSIQYLYKIYDELNKKNM